MKYKIPSPAAIQRAFDSYDLASADIGAKSLIRAYVCDVFETMADLRGVLLQPRGGASMARDALQGTGV